MARVWRKKRKPKRRGYVRPSRAKPRSGWSVRQLTQLTGIPVRTIRNYLIQGVLPRSPFRAAATRYQRPQLLMLLAIRHLRAVEKMPLSDIRKRLAAATPQELEALATTNLVPGLLADVLGVQPQVAALPSAARSPGRFESANWSRVMLGLGLELHISDNASSRMQALALQIRELCEAAESR